MPTKQITFNMVSEHLINQGTRSSNPMFGCAYRGDGGLRCAIGALLPDESYTHELEGVSAQLGTVAEILNYLEHDLPLCRDLQIVHDRIDAANWPKALQKVAHIHQLTVPHCVSSRLAGSNVTDLSRTSSMPINQTTAHSGVIDLAPSNHDSGSMGVIDQNQSDLTKAQDNLQPQVTNTEDKLDIFAVGPISEQPFANLPAQPDVLPLEGPTPPKSPEPQETQEPLEDQQTLPISSLEDAANSLKSAESEIEVLDPIEIDESELDTGEDDYNWSGIR